MIRGTKFRGVERGSAEGSRWRAYDHFQGVSTYLGEYESEEQAGLRVDDILVSRRGILAAYQSGELNLPEHPVRKAALAAAQAEEDARQAALAKAASESLARAVIPDERKQDVWESWVTGREDVARLARRLFVAEETVKGFLKERALSQLRAIGIEVATGAPASPSPAPAARSKKSGFWA